MRISLIVAMAENGVIGRDGGLPWHIPGDLRFFKEMTMGKPVVMGRKTWLSLGRALPGRDNIVITRDETFVADGAHVTHSLDEALDVANDQINKQTDVTDPEVMVIGGAEIYRQTIGRADRIYLTEVCLNPDGDAVLDDFNRTAWHVTRLRNTPAEGKAPAYSISILDRKPV